jgi:hypothetical protein
MRILNAGSVLVLALGLLGHATGAPTATAACDRACLKGFADQLLGSIVAHNAAGLALSQVYAATENSVPSALNLMVIWRTVTPVKSSYYVIDPKSGQVFLIATLSEGPNDALLQPYVDMLKRQQSSGLYTAPAVRPLPATAAVAEIHRIYDAKLQGLHLLVNLGAPGSRSPWVIE